MRFSFFSLTFIGLIALTACGGEPDVVLMDRRYLTAEQLDQQAEDLLANAAGEVLDTYGWEDGEHKVLTLLSRDRDAEGYEGIFLRHYQLGDQGAQLLWTYQDSISCMGAAAGAGEALKKAKNVTNSSPSLKTEAFTADGRQEFVLRYHLNCAPEETGESNRTLVVINAASGTPQLRLDGQVGKLTELPASRAERLLTIWEG